MGQEKIKCLAIDDEYLALDLVADYISKVPKLELARKCKSPLDALDIMQKEKIDLIFLDIQMPDISGIDFLKTLTYKPVIILTTAYQEYALEGYELDVTDYLLKPFRFERFLKAVNKAISVIELKNSPKDVKPIFQEPSKTDKSFVFLKSGFKSYKVNFNDILYVEGLKEYINIFTKERKYTKLDRLKNFESELPNDKFLRIHKSYIIAIDKVESIFGNTVEIAGKQLPVGRSYKTEVVEVLS